MASMLRRGGFVVPAFLAALAGAPAFAAECDPRLAATDIANHVNARDSTKLAASLLSNAKPSKLFERAQGLEGLEKSIKEMVANLMDARTADSVDLAGEELAATVAKFEEGIKAACDSLAAGKSDDDAAKQAVKAAKLSGGDSHYHLLLGTTNSLEGDGNFSSGFEASLMSVTNFKANVPFVNSNPLRREGGKKRKAVKPLVGTFEITFSEIGSIDDEDSGGAPTSPFAAGGGFFRLNAFLDSYYTPGDAISGYGMRAGIGFSTQPSDADSDVDARARGFLGAVFRANYGKDDRGRKGKGEVFIGYAKDRFWKYERVIADGTMPPTTMTINETDRVVVDARMDVPHVFESEDIRLHARIFADLPASGDGPSDVRISLLITANLGELFP